MSFSLFARKRTARYLGKGSRCEVYGSLGVNAVHLPLMLRTVVLGFGFGFGFPVFSFVVWDQEIGSGVLVVSSRRRLR